MREKDKSGIMELIVYYDENYPNSWVPKEESEKVVRFLKSKGFSEYNSEDLAKWMRKSIDENTCHQSLVVFSQDIAPETVCHDRTSNALIRTYLDCGGTVLWIGDIPFHYQGLNPEHTSKIKREIFKGIKDIKEKLWTDQGLRPELFEGLKNVKESLWVDENARFARVWDRVGTFGVLGVKSVSFDFPSSRVAIPKEGKFLGLRNAWYGYRPITIRGSRICKNKPIALATSKPSLMMPKEKWVFFYEKEKRIPFASFLDYMSKLSGLVPAIILAITAVVSLLAGSAWILTLSLISAATVLTLAYVVYWLLLIKAIHANAWFKNFNSEYPTSGFIRIWDFRVERITDGMLEDLYCLVLARIEMKTRFEKSRK